VIRTLLAIACAALVSVSASAQVTPEFESALTKAEALWAAKKPASYQFTVRLTCFCRLPPAPPTFLVKDGVSEPVEKLDADVRKTLSSSDTVEKLFAHLRRAISMKAVKVVADFDPSLGYPTHGETDISKTIADDEMVFDVTGFKAK
jgi:hypothetical protein